MILVVFIRPIVDLAETLEEDGPQPQVNLFGEAQLIQLHLPGMREQRTGKTINITLMNGRCHPSWAPCMAPASLR